MFTKFYKNIAIPMMYHTSTSATKGALGYFYNTTQGEQVSTLSDLRDIYGNKLCEYTNSLYETPFNITYFGNNTTRDTGSFFSLCVKKRNTYTYYDTDNNIFTDTQPSNYYYFNDTGDKNIEQYSPVDGVGNFLSSDYRYIAPMYKDAIGWIYSQYQYTPTYSVIIGKSNTPNTQDTYKLGDMVSSLECNYSFERTSYGYNITIINTSNSNLSINELGVVSCTQKLVITPDNQSGNQAKYKDLPNILNFIYNTDVFSRESMLAGGFPMDYTNDSYSCNVGIFPVLLCRTVLQSPVTLAPEEQTTITWNFKLNE